MRVFVTGSTGFIGSGIVRALVEGGHFVTGLVRSAEKARALSFLGAHPVVGDYKDQATLKAAARGHDALVHAAIEYTAEARAAEAKLAATALDAGVRHFVYTGGCWDLGETHGPADEDASTDHPALAAAWRVTVEKAVLAAATASFTTAVVRPAMVFGRREGFLGSMFADAETGGAASFVGTGDNRWSLIHRDDLAALYRAIIDKAGAGVFHGSDGHATRVADIARAAGEAAGAAGRTRSIPLEEARKTMGPVADALCLDQDVVSRRSRELGWAPRLPPFVEAAKRYFDEWKTAV